MDNHKKSLIYNIIFIITVIIIAIGTVLLTNFKNDLTIYSIIFFVSIIIFLIGVYVGYRNIVNNRHLTHLPDKKVLRNKHVIFIYDVAPKTILCINALNIKAFASVELEKQSIFAHRNIYTIFDFIDREISKKFNDETDYSDLVKLLKKLFEDVKEISPENGSITQPVNLNEASEDFLVGLTGINIAIAKKIVKRINTKGDYLSVDEMCKEMKIKKHLRTQLNICLYTEPTSRSKKEIKRNNDRMIDL